MIKHCNGRPGPLATVPATARLAGTAHHGQRPAAAGSRAGHLSTVPGAPGPVLRQAAEGSAPSDRSGSKPTSGPAGLGARDRAQGWLRGAMAALAALAVAAAAVSWDAQYVLVRSARHNPAVAALEAGIPDVGAVIFAALGIALALHGRRALRARALNVACVAVSLTMNSLASAPGWRDLAIWVMPSAVYALASDSLIGVVRAMAVARARQAGRALDDDSEATPLAVLGGLALWFLRLAVAPLSTLAGLRRWVTEECPVAPGRKAPRTAVTRSRALPASRPAPVPERPAAPPRPGRPGKQARMLAIAAQRHDLAAIPLTQVSRIANAIAAEVDLSPGTARRVLLVHVRALQNAPQPAKPGTHASEGTP